MSESVRLVIDQVVILLALLLNSTLFVLCSVQKYTKHLKKESRGVPSARTTELDLRLTAVMHLLSPISMFFSALFAVLRTVMVFDAAGSSSSDCQWWTGTAASFWQLSKLTLYCFFILRLRAVFCSPGLSKEIRIHPRSIDFSLTAVIIAYLIIQILMLLFWQSDYVDGKQCVGTPPLWMSVVFTSWDFSVSVGFTVVFISKLNLIASKIEEPSESMQKSKNTKLSALTVKLLVLVSIAVISTLMAVFFTPLLRMSSFIVMDTVVNCCTLFLMSSQNAWLFEYLCAPLVDLILSCVIGKKETEERRCSIAAEEKEKKIAKVTMMDPPVGSATE